MKAVRIKAKPAYRVRKANEEMREDAIKKLGFPFSKWIDNSKNATRMKKRKKGSDHRYTWTVRMSWDVRTRADANSGGAGE